MQQIRDIKFNEDKSIHEIDTHKPTIKIDKIIFATSDKEWATRLSQAAVTVQFTCFDKHGQERKSSSSTFSLLEYISPNHVQAVFSLSRIFTFAGLPHPTPDPECEFWRIAIQVKNLSFLPMERLDIILI